MARTGVRCYPDGSQMIPRWHQAGSRWHPDGIQTRHGTPTWQVESLICMEMADARADTADEVCVKGAVWKSVCWLLFAKCVEVNGYGLPHIHTHT